MDTAGCPPLRRVKWTSAPPPARTRLGPIGLGGRISALRHCVAIQSRGHCAFGSKESTTGQARLAGLLSRAYPTRVSDSDSGLSASPYRPVARHRLGTAVT